MLLRRVLTYGLALVLVIAPLFFGSVQPAASALLVAACLVLGALWVVWRARSGQTPVPWKEPLLVAVLMVAGVGIAQSVPLPRTILQTLSPTAVDLRDRYEPHPVSSAIRAEPALVTERGWRPLTLHAWATRQAILRLLAFAIVALIALDLGASGPGRSVLIGALIASGGFQAFYGLAEYFTDRQHIFGYAKRHYTDVATGTFINRNHFAGYLEMTLPLAIALAAATIARLRSRRGQTVAERVKRVTGRAMFTASLLLVLTMTMATALVSSRSRMGIASMVLALLALSLFLLWWGRGRGFVAAAVALLGGLLLIFSQGGAANALLARFMTTFSQFGGDMGRWQIWSQVATMVGTFPVFGAGLGVFPHLFPVFRRTGEGFAIAHAHNDYLELAAEIGAIGCAVVFLGGWLVIRSVQLRGVDRRPESYFGYAAIAGLLAIGLHSLTDFNLAIPSNAVTFAALVGLALAWLRPPAPTLVPQQADGPLSMARAALPAAGLLMVAMLAGAPLIAGVENQAESVDESIATPAWIEVGDPEHQFAAAMALGDAAIGDMQTLVEARPDGAAIPGEAAVFIEQRLVSAIELQRVALRRHPTSARGHLLLGHLLLGGCAAVTPEEGARDRCLPPALEEFRIALELNSMSASIHAQVARFLVAAWPLLDPSARLEARVIIDRAVRMNWNDRELQQLVRAVLPPQDHRDDPANGFEGNR